MRQKLLVFVPTYNEHENVEKMCREVLSLGLSPDLVFMDDGSPDGTGEVLDRLAAEHSNVRVIHRQGKLGIGSAHLDGIRYAYDHGYDKLVTLDCDFTHSPADIPRMLDASGGHDITVGSRFLEKGSLPGWNLVRRCLTVFGHFLTRNLLAIECDASGAFRVYDLRHIPRELFDLITSRSYAFFFESLFTAVINGCSIKEIPIILPARTYGHSKMTLREAARSAMMLVRLRLERWINPGRFRVGRQAVLQPGLDDPQDWSAYWERKQNVSGLVYELVAAVYRRLIIKRNLDRALRGNFAKGAALLHAGCGSGQVDGELHERFSITAVDICPQALYLYSQNNPRARRIEHADILSLPYADESWGGVYNLGVIEHFTGDELRRMLREFYRVLQAGGKVLLFWPHRSSTSVLVLKVVHWALRKVFGRQEALHPPEISLLKDKREARQVLRECGLELCDYSFSMRDCFVQAIVVGRKPLAAAQVVVSSSRRVSSDVVGPSLHAARQTNLRRRAAKATIRISSQPCLHR